MKKIVIIPLFGLSIFVFNKTFDKNCSAINNNISAFSEGEAKCVYGSMTTDATTISGFPPNARVYWHGTWFSSNKNGEIYAVNYDCLENKKCKSICQSDGNGNVSIWG